MLLGSTFYRGNNCPDRTVVMTSVPKSECRPTVSSTAKSDANWTRSSSAVDIELPVAVDRFRPYLPISLFEILSLYFTHKNSVVDITNKK